MTDQIKEGFRLSPQQRHVWQLTLPDPAAYLVRCAIRLEGPLHLTALAAALRQLVEQHQILRTSFQRLPGMRFPVQVVGATKLTLERVNLTEFAASAQQPEVDRLFAEAGQVPFDLAQEAGPRFTLLSLAEQQHLLFVVLPALCADARTLENLVEKIGQLYAATIAGDLPADGPVQYVQFSEWQNELLEDEDERPGREYWLQHDLSVPTAVNLPFELQPAEPAFAPDTHMFEFEPAVLRKLTDVAQQHDTTVRVLLLACWQVLLWHQLRLPEIVVSCLFDGRKYEELHRAIGLFSRYLPIHAQLEARTPFNQLVKQLEATMQEAAQWQESFDWPRQHPAAAETVSGGRFQPFAFEYMEASPPHTAAGISFSMVNQRALIERAKVKLDCLRRNDALIAEIQYDTSFVRHADAVKLCEQYERVVQSALTNPRAVINQLEILGANERRQLLCEFNDTRVAYPNAVRFQQLFEAQVERTPEQVAVVFEAERLTYREFNRRANQLARYLQRLGIGPEQRVALVLERSLETLVALLGVMKAGGAYVPLEPGYPPERLALMLADADAVLTEQRLLERVPEQTTRVVCLDRIAEQITGESGANLTDELSSANLAYVIFTSGSTGQPKGVAIEHRQLANYLASIQDKLDLPANASYATVSTFAADLGHTMIFPALCAGGALHIISPERATDARALAEYFRREQIDCLKIVPSHLEALLSAEHPERVLPRQRLIVGGEASGCDWIAKLQVLAPDCRIFNHYGPTETTVGVLTYRVESEQIEPRVGTLPLGRPIANTQVYLLDADQQLVPLGTPGELHVGGANVARGYLNRPAQTAEKFIPNPFGGEAGARLYKTGDLARYLPDGRIQFLGRVDQQVKIRGYRIELGEIEVALEQQAEVREAVVLASEDEPGNKRLVAYVVPAQKQVLTISELRRALSEKLPPYMLPAAFVMLDALPLTPNGKVDRRALPAPDEMRPDLTRTPVVPRTPLEEALAAMWTEVLRLDRIGVHDNFFELGGHSLLAMRILSRLRETFQVELPLRILFETTTIAQLAQALIAHEKTPGQTENIARVLKKIKGMSAEDVREALTARQAAQSG